MVVWVLTLGVMHLLILPFWIIHNVHQMRSLIKIKNKQLHVVTIVFILITLESTYLMDWGLLG
jgi:branched-subunit amino acid transport protein AzlD